MPITYQLKPDERLVILSHVGAVSDNEFLSFYKALYEDTRFDKSFNLFVDLRLTESSARSPSALQDFADFMRNSS